MTRCRLAGLIDKFDALPMEERLKGNDRYGPHVADRSANLADYLLAHNYFDNSQMASVAALMPSADRTTWEQAEAHFRNYISGPGAIAHRAIVQVAALTADMERLNHEVAAWIEACGKAVDDRNGARAERDALRAASERALALLDLELCPRRGCADAMVDVEGARAQLRAAPKQATP